MQMYDLPDPRGHFGPYGGVFVAETLSHALDELRDAYERCRARSGVHGRVPLRAQALRRPAEPGLPRQALVGAARRRADLPQARGPEPHRRAQDQQHHRPGAARAPHGQEARDRGDRRRHARRGLGDGGGAFRHEVRRLHGLGGHQAPGAERLPHEAARRRGGAGRVGLEDAQGRAQRSDARLGDERRGHLLHHRHGRGPASVSDDGARFPVGDRRGMQAADARDDRPPARRGDRLRRRRLERDGHLLSVHRGREGAPDRRRSGGRGPGDRQARGLAQRRHARRAARQPHLPAAGRQRADHRDAFGVRRPGLSRRRAGARLAEGHARAEYVSITDDEALKALQRPVPTARASFPALESAHAVAYAAKIAPSMPKDKALLVNLSGRGDKDMQTVADRMGIKL